MNRNDRLAIIVKPYYSGSDPAHDWLHIMRVLSLVNEISSEENARSEIAQAAALCHDLVNVPKNDPRRSEASQLSAEKAEGYLREVGYTKEEIPDIQTCIREHSFSRGVTPSLLESKIVQDADRLDALGAIGILRCAATSAKMKSSFYHADDPWAKERPKNDKLFMLDHYEEKLYNLPSLMNTNTGKRIATMRADFMKNFISVLKGEIICGQ